MASSGALEGKVALVTGGAVRIGAAVAERLAREGAGVVLHHHASHEAARETAARLEKMGARVWSLEADFAVPGDAERLAREAREAAGRLDLLVNNASVYPPQPVEETTDALLHRTLAVNAWAPLALMREFARGGDDGAVVNVLDTHLHRITREKFAYQLSKHALSWLTRHAALAYAPRVRVNAVAPGAILPPPSEGEAYLDRLGARLPLRRHGSPADVADAVVYLATARFVTGVTVEVDGGEHLEGRLDG